MVRLFLRIMPKLEKILVRMVVIGVMALVVLQFTIASAADPLDFYYTLSQKIEVVPPEFDATTLNPQLTFIVEGGDGSKLKLLINDRAVGDFKQGSMTVEAKNGDRLAVDARSAPKGMRLKVTRLDGKVIQPKLNQLWILQGSILELGQIVVK